ncbi:hypothetical protein GCM10011608_40540 [Micromonospora sonchi]|uniref:Transposase IS4-like domain-containing protein n=1 Tax=Micromonospora sonchi TaxID=1763543 RepID=A0A917U1X0_9ACTN|nr:hypothetical protein GCM10011608_40540 [Micromonospora sonchi]
MRVAAGREPEPSAAVLDAQSITSIEGVECRGPDMGKKTTGRKRHLVVDDGAYEGAEWNVHAVRRLVVHSVNPSGVDGEAYV